MWAKIRKECFFWNGIILLDLPSPSPDLNPIEYLFYTEEEALKITNELWKQTLILSLVKEIENITIENYKSRDKNVNKL